jgi:hypothetical protein
MESNEKDLLDFKTFYNIAVVSYKVVTSPSGRAPSEAINPRPGSSISRSPAPDQGTIIGSNAPRSGHHQKVAKRPLDEAADLAPQYNLMLHLLVQHHLFYFKLFSCSAKK